MSNPRNPDAVVRARASENDQLGQQIGSEPSSPLYQPQVLRIVVAPIANGRFTARLVDSDCVIVRSSHQPFVEGARLLINIGYLPNCHLKMWHSGSADCALSAPLKSAARLTIEESAHGPVFRRFRMAPPSAVEAPSIAQSKAALSEPWLDLMPTSQANLKTETR
jgi:hypothetical protein